MYGSNPIRPPITGDGTKLFVQSIFPTIQGEGPAAGLPSVFIRLGGCNLACSFCDTEFESFEEMGVDDVINAVNGCTSPSRYVVITGGEPFRQPIGLLCNLLIEAKYKVQIETNGTLYRDLPEAVEIVCSPKSSKSGYGKIREDLLLRISALKFLVSKHIPEYSIIPELGQTMHNIPVFVQPMDEQDAGPNKANSDYAVELAIKMGYRLSLQIHKILDIP
ncbi:MAG: 7-carboxy-7-deazaguanine synthase QueE [Pseudomonadota bacterium]